MGVGTEVTGEDTCSMVREEDAAEGKTGAEEPHLDVHDPNVGCFTLQHFLKVNARKP
jgi:hypothetical protein